ncbi:hypothetical protein GJAV_G00211440, partial [Gymnothorax javanicus]
LRSHHQSVPWRSDVSISLATQKLRALINWWATEAYRISRIRDLNVPFILLFKCDMASAANPNAVQETMEVLMEISELLNTGLDMESLSICVRLCEQGINPEALSTVIKELRKVSDAQKASESSAN